MRITAGFTLQLARMLRRMPRATSLAFLAFSALACLAGNPVLAQQQLGLGEAIQVISVPLNVRETPGTAGNLLDRIESRQTVLIVDASPHWADGYWWWKVELGSGLTGWIAEGDGTENYLEAQVEHESPVPAQQVEEAASTRPEVPEVSDGAEAGSSAPPPAHHLPEQLRSERARIDEESGGLRIALARFAASAGRGGPSFSWEFTKAANLEDTEVASAGHFWCERRLLTSGPPYYALLQAQEQERFEALLALADGSLTDGRLRLWDFQISCTPEGGLQLQSRNLNRTLAVLAAPTVINPMRQSAGEEFAVEVRSRNSVTSGEVHWLQVTAFDLPQVAPATSEPQLYPLSFDEAGQLQAPDQLSRFTPVLLGCEWLPGLQSAGRKALPTQSCRRTLNSSEFRGTLSLDLGTGSVEWFHNAPGASVPE